MQFPDFTLFLAALRVGEFTRQRELKKKKTLKN